MLSLTLRQMEYAVAVARHAGVTAAAEALHVSQPALSVALAQLEALLGRPLFLRRRGGRLMPTAFGRDWLEQAETQLQALKRLMQPGTALAQEVRLAVFEDIAPAALAPLLTYAASHAPHLVLVPQVMGFEALTEALRRGQADLALTWDLGLQTDMARQVLAQVAPHVVLTPDHPLAGKPRILLRDLTNLPLILADQGLSLGHMRGLFAQRGLTPQIRHRTASLDLMRSYAANGLGVGMSYSNPAPRQSHDGKPLLTRPVSDGGAEPIVLAHLAQNPLSEGAVTLAQMMPLALHFLIPKAEDAD